MKAACHILISAAIAAALSGCASPYEQPPSQPAALLKIAGYGSALICTDGGARRLMQDAGGYAPIPAGRRAVISVQFWDRGGECRPSFSFVPAAGQRYQLMIDVVHSLCNTTVMREERSAALGVVLEGSAVRDVMHCR